MNCIAGIALDGVVALEMTTSTVNVSVFFDFVRRSLIPNMQQFDGINSRSIAVMDNLTVHHADEVTSLFDQAGIPVFFLPPYSPDLNPAEECFSYVKGYLREHDSILQLIPDSRQNYFSRISKCHRTSLPSMDSAFWLSIIIVCTYTIAI